MTRWAFVVMAALLPACTCIRGEVPAPVAWPGRGQLHAGAARVDITPLPGIPMGGFSTAGQVSRGHWGRLFARAVYVEAPDGTALVLVATDLWAVPAGLRDRVAELVTLDAHGRHLGSARIVVAASHTHHSPANYSSSAGYNLLAGVQPGFDRALFDFLAERIARAVLDAVLVSEPAELRTSQSKLPLVFRNRSMPPFDANEEAVEIIAGNPRMPVGPLSSEFPDPRAYKAVDPLVRVLTARAADGRVLAVAAFAAAHPTSIGPSGTVYTPALFGVAAHHAEFLLAASAPEPPVVALFNGAEGDVSAAWEDQTAYETVRLGKELGVHVSGLASAGRTRTVSTVRAALRYERIEGRVFTDETGQPGRTGAYVMIGASAEGGAEDGRTSKWPDERFEGMTGPSPPTQYPKLPAADLCLSWWRCLKPLSVIVDALAGPPEQVPLAIHDLGGLVLVSIPGEATTVTGLRVRRAVAQGLGVAEADVWPVGLANEYLSYFATPEEYDHQHYEGASTLYGRDSSRWLAWRYHALARDLRDGTAGTGEALRFGHSPGLLRRRFKSSNACDAPGTPDGVDELVELVGAVRPRAVRLHTFVISPQDADGRVVAAPAAAVHSRVSGGAWRLLETDAGPSLAVAMTGCSGGKQQWTVAWGFPQAASAGTEYKIVVSGETERLSESQPFRAPGGTP